jgi:PAS domain S-box-containing protein
MSALTDLLILNVAGNEATRSARSQTLRQAEFRVVEAAAGGEALCLMAAEIPHLVILDVDLPDISSLEVGRRIKANSAMAFVPVLYLSAVSVEEKDWARELKSGADSYLLEPVEPQVLVAMVRALLRMGQAEASVRTSARDWQTTFDAISDGLALLDGQGRVLRCNQAFARILEKPSSEICGRPCDELVYTRTNPAEATPFQRMLQTRQRESRDLYLGDGWFHVTSDPILAENGAITGAVCILSDITERKHAEQERAQLLLREQAARREAEAANRAKDTFLATVSHEVRTPLNAIMGWARLLRNGKLDTATGARAIESIERNATVQSQLIDDLLDISRIVTGKLNLEVGPVELGPIILAAIESIRPAAETKEIAIESVLDPAVEQISGDPRRLQQVVGNLLSNAIKFTPEGGRVNVRLDRADACARITVSDTGQGISPEFLPYVFDRFRQADATNNQPQTGLGIGLAIVRHLVELHGGTVQADSPSEGQGATFTVKLPLVQLQIADFELRNEPVAGKESALCSPQSEVSLGGLRVLVVDDEADARELLVVMLTQYGANVRAVASAQEALEALDRWPPDVLVSDIAMPDMDGYALIQKVRARPPERGGRIPAVALTAYARVEDRTHALVAGYHMHIAKPVNPAELAVVIATLSKG